MKNIYFGFALLIGVSITSPLFASVSHSNHSNMHAITQNKNPYVTIMDKMMVDMHMVKTDTSIEINFLEQMIIHHKGAVEMSEYQIKNGKDSGMIQLAKSILAEQQSEIEKMEYLISIQKTNKNSVTADYLQKMEGTMVEMMKNTPLSISENIDISFAELMMPHHQGAIDMAKVLIPENPEPQVLGFSKKLISTQQIEIDLMKDYLNKIKK